MQRRNDSAVGTSALRSRILEVEDRIRRRRRNVRRVLGTVGQTVKERMVSPGAIGAAVLFGAAIQRDHRLRGVTTLAMFQIAGAGLRLVRKFLAATTRGPGQPAGR